MTNCEFKCIHSDSLSLPLSLPLPFTGSLTTDAVSLNVIVCSRATAAKNIESRQRGAAACHATQKRKREAVDDGDEDDDVHHESKPEALLRRRQNKEIDMLAGQAAYRENVQDPHRATNEQLAELRDQGVYPIGVDNGARNIYASYDLRTEEQDRCSSQEFRFVVIVFLSMSHSSMP